MSGAELAGGSDRLFGRNGSIWRDHVRGMTTEALSAKYGLSVAAIRGILQSVRAGIPQRDREAMILREYELYNVRRQMLVGVILLGPQPVKTVTGKIVRTENGDMIREDCGQMLAANRELERLQRSMAILFGLNAPTKIDVTTTDAVDAAIVELAERMRQRAATPA